LAAYCGKNKILALDLVTELRCKLEFASVVLLDSILMPTNAHVKGRMLQLVKGDTSIEFTCKFGASYAELVFDSETTKGVAIGQSLQEVHHAKVSLFFRNVDHFT